MNWLTRIFAGIKEPPSLQEIAGLLKDLAAQEKRRDSAKRLASLGPAYLRSALNANRGVAFFDATGPSLSESSLDAADLRKLQGQGVAAFTAEVQAKIDARGRRLKAVLDRDRQISAQHLLIISADPDNEYRDLRAAAGFYLGTHLAPDALGVIAAGLKHEHRDVRRQSAHLMAVITKNDHIHERCGPEVVAALVGALESDDRDIRQLCAQALGRLHAKNAATPLQHVAEADQDGAVRDAAKTALDQLAA